MPKDNFEFQKETFENYKKTFPRSDEMKEQVLSVIEKNMEDNEKSAYMWRVFFEADKEMYQKIALLEVKNQAIKTYNDYVSEPHPVLLKGAASLAHTVCVNQDTLEPDLEKEKIWLNIFSKEPVFAQKLQEEKEYWLEHRTKTREEYANYYNKMEEINNLPIVATYEVFVPFKLEKDHKECALSPEFDVLLSEITKDFNSFGIHGYMVLLSNKCSNSTVEIENGFVFKFECYDKILQEELEDFKKDFLGQLSDGWGEGASQRKILIGSKEVSIDFDVDNASEVLCKTNISKNKIKLK